MAAALVVAFSVPAVSFTPGQRQTLGAVAVMGGSFKQLRIRHTELTRASAVTREAIILCEAGDELPASRPPFTERLTPGSDFGPISDRKLRVTVRFRFVSQDQVLGLVPAPAGTDLPSIEGPDPIACAFLITPSSFTAGILQYRITAQQVQLQGGVLVPIKDLTYPPKASPNDEPWVTLGVTANASDVFGPAGGKLILEDGNPVVGNSALEIPAGVLPRDESITLDEIPLDESSARGGVSARSAVFPGGLSQPLVVYRLDSDGPAHGIMKISLRYPDFEFPTGPDGVIDGTQVLVRDIAVMSWDGFAWRRLGGQVNTKNNTISVKINSFNYVAIAAAPPLSPEERRPMEKIITPNGDGKNDVANFLLGDLADNVKVEIFDIGGHRIKTIMSLSNLEWDGRDDSGSTVESGVYIYQYTVDGKLISGLIAVAK